MIAWKVVSDDSWPKRTCGIERASGKVHASHFGYEESKTDANWCKIGSLVLLCSEHEDHEDKFCCEEHLNEEPLNYGRSPTQSCVDVHGTGKEGTDYASSAHGGYNLSEDDGDGAKGFDGSDEIKSEGDLCGLSDL